MSWLHPYLILIFCRSVRGPRARAWVRLCSTEEANRLCSTEEANRLCSTVNVIGVCFELALQSEYSVFALNWLGCERSFLLTEKSESTYLTSLPIHINLIVSILSGEIRSKRFFILIVENIGLI